MNGRIGRILLCRICISTGPSRHRHANIPSYFINGKSISTELTFTPEGGVVAALRLTEYEIRPKRLCEEFGADTSELVYEAAIGCRCR